MKKNIGTSDKLFRLCLILLIAVATYLNLLPNKLVLALLILSTYILFTTFLNFSPLYKVLGINTFKEKEDKNKQ